MKKMIMIAVFIVVIVVCFILGWLSGPDEQEMAPGKHEQPQYAADANK